jgi:very-short-patch-repair endonuclease
MNRLIKFFRERKLSDTIRRRKRGEYETGIERRIRVLLRSMRIENEQEKYFKGVGMVDFYLPRYNVVIECDGFYWHSSKAAKAKDRRRDRELSRLGIRVLRLPEEEINGDIDLCSSKIEEFTFKGK